MNTAVMPHRTFERRFYVAISVDTLRHRRLHPAFGWGAPLLLASQQLMYFATKTEPWTHFVKQLFT